MVEFALILPLLLLLVLGVVEFGYRYAKASQLNNFAYIGARDVSINDAISSDTSDRIAAAAPGASVSIDACSGENASVTITATLDSPTGLFFEETFDITATGAARCDG